MRQIDLNPVYELTAPPTLPLLTAEELHAQCRVDSDDENALLDRYIAGATELVETDSRMFLRPAVLTLHLDCWPTCGPVLIERCPVTAIQAIRYIDGNGDEQEWEDWHAQLSSRPARLDKAFGTSWPVHRRQAGAIEIDFDCGFAEGAAPEVALQMIRMLAAHWFENRETAVVGSISKEHEFAYTAMLDRLGY